MKNTLYRFSLLLYALIGRDFAMSTFKLIEHFQVTLLNRSKLALVFTVCSNKLHVA